MTTEKMQILQGVTDPEQIYIDQQIAKLTKSETDAYIQYQYTDGIEKLRASQPDRDWCSLYAHTWRVYMDNLIKCRAWFVQNAREVHEAQRVGLSQAESAVKVVQKLQELRRQGRKTAKVEELLDLFAEGVESSTLNN